MLKDLDPDERSGERLGRRLTLYDLLALGFVGLSLLMVGWVLLILGDPYGPLNPFPPPLPPTRVTIAPYQPPTDETPLPTWTPTPTAQATIVPSETPTSAPFPIIRPFHTVTPPPTPAPHLTPTPSNTPSLYTYTLEGEAVVYGPNHNGQECAWQSIAGRIGGLNGEPVAEGLYVQISGEGVDELVPTGSQPAFGPSGYELMLGGVPRRGQYVVRLIGQSGEPLSDEILVETIDRCEQNVAVVNFVQNR
jgi:hypothetical protein